MEIDSVSYMKFVFALLFVLGLIGGFALLAKKFGMGNRGPSRRASGNRLEIIESMALDAKRRVVLIRRDNKEHLLLTGGTTELVVESEIDVDPNTLRSEQDNEQENFNLIDGLRYGFGGRKNAQKGLTK